MMDGLLIFLDIGGARYDRREQANAIELVA